MSGLRYNAGKLRYDLVPGRAVEEIAKVFTFGANKYAPRNWEKGMSWTTVLASLKRHIAAFESGEDFDPESGLLHLGHAGCNIAFLLEYYKTHPEFDDRVLPYLQPKRIALDVDEVLAGFVCAYSTRFNVPIPTSWNFDYWFRARIEELREDKEFWLGLPKLVKELPFEPIAYVSNRSFDVEWTQEWIQNSGLPAVDVFHTKDKAEVLKRINADIFVDDSYHNFVTLNNAGVCTFLYDAPHNRTFNVGYKRLQDLNNL